MTKPTKDPLIISTRNYPDGRRVIKRRLQAGSKMVLTETTFQDGTRSTLYDVERPPRHRDESPIQYYRRTKVVDNRFTHRHKDW